MSPLQISALIQKIALQEIENCTYLRATDPQANIDADKLDLENITFVLYNNRPEVVGEIPADLSNLITERIPIEITFLVLARLDDTDGQTDERIDALYGHAQKMFDLLSQENTTVVYAEGYTIALGDDETKVYDKVMSGIRLSFELISQRGITC